MYSHFFKRRLKHFIPFWVLLLLPITLQLPELTGRWTSDPVVFTADVGHSARVAGGTPWIDPNVGYQAQALGKLSADLWLQGNAPWWNSYSGVGLPLAAEAQPASLFLPFILLMHFRHGWAWLELLMQIIAGLCTYAVLRKIRVSNLAALTGAVLFELNGTFAWHGAPIVTPIAFLPMLLLGIESLRDRIESGTKGGWWLIPLALAWSVYAGFPETAYINGLLAAVWALARTNDLTRSQKIGFLSKLSGAVITGVLLSLPLIIPFEEYVRLSFVGGHDNLFAHVALPSVSLPLSLMPWVYGPIARYSYASQTLNLTWGNIGGYLPALQAAVILLGLFFSARKIYFVLIGWMLICLAKTFDLPPFADAVNLIPLIKSVAFFRYCAPSWEFAAAVCVALSIHGIQQKLPVSKRRIIFAFAITLIGTLATLWISRPLVTDLWRLPGYSKFLKVALFWLLMSLVSGLTLLMLRDRWRRAVRGLVVLLTLDACLAFILPFYSYARHVKLHEDGIAFLQQHLGVQRVYSLGPLAPNYGGFFKIAEINHNYLPVSKNWLTYIHKYLDPEIDPITFNGTYGQTDNGEHAAQVLRNRQRFYEELGVTYIITRSGSNPFELKDLDDVKPIAEPALLFPLGEKNIIKLRQQMAIEGSRKISALSIFVDNSIKADGQLSVKLCNDAGACSEGNYNLTQANTGRIININFNKPLSPAKDGNTQEWFTATISQHGSERPIAIWLENSDGRKQTTLGDIPIEGFSPIIALKFVDTLVKPALVYIDPTMAIYELRHPKPYYEILQGSCVIEPKSRTTLFAECKKPSQLLRREAFYPGWDAFINGVKKPVELRNEIFQGVNIPEGKYTVEFRYQPTHLALILLGFGAGTLIFLFGVFVDLPLPRRERHWR